MLRARLLQARGAHVGSHVLVDAGVRFYFPGSMLLDDGCEILRNSTLDGNEDEVATAIRIGARTRVKENVWLACYGGSIDIGQNVLLGRNTVVHGHGGVTIGAHSMLAPGCMVFSSTHVTWLGGAYQAQGFVRESTSVGSNVWLGAGAIVLGGSSIGDGAIVAAGSVVRGEVMADCLYRGNPAIFVKRVQDIHVRDSRRIETWDLE